MSGRPLRIVAVAGPLAGRVYPWSGAEFTIGRESGNDVELPDLTASRRHCRLVHSGDGALLEDLGSANGTLLHGRAVTGPTPLVAGEEFAVGDSRFMVEAPTSTLAHPVPADTGAPECSLRSTLRLRPEQSRYDRDGAPPATPRVVADLKALLDAARRLAEARSLDELAQTLAETAFAALPADRCLLTLEEETAVRGWRRDRATPTPFAVSRTVLEQVRHDGTAVLSNDVRQDAALSPSRSLAVQQVSALLAVPVRVRGRWLGLLYLDQTGVGEPFDKDHLEWAVAAAGIAALALDALLQRVRLEEQNRLLRDEMRQGRAMVGDSPRMQELYRLLARVAPVDSTVLLTGESGTGKELAARALHQGSARAAAPFVAINCAVLDDMLLASELFGHEKGAFTGAVAQKKGKFELAEGGTLFLDELGELAVPLQAKLLRALQERVIERVGGTRPIPVDVRFVAATNRDLRALMAEGRFRKDLYFRLNVFPVAMPALRERHEDIPLLATFFAERYAIRTKRRVSGVSPEALELLRAHDWPGNVRELENVIERAVVIGQDEWIRPEDLPDELRDLAPLADTGSPKLGSLQEASREARRRTVLEALRSADWSYADAARQLGIHPNNLHRLVTKLGLRGEGPRRGDKSP